MGLGGVSPSGPRLGRGWFIKCDTKPLRDPTTRSQSPAAVPYIADEYWVA
ncbi:hypothetical protein GCM10022267_91150 [Lentzea roselyniae]|uniref:Uncharacterized protein n=1 Tax=Lentzea roselyniae TaxID=531940 RepID=A0ABP7CIX5_9PSEU